MSRLNIEIGALQKTSLLDYPDKVSSIIFLKDCNLNCPYCHNPELRDPNTKPLNHKEIFSFLKKRKNLIDAVTITGGEPTIHKDLPLLIKKIKSLGYLVKLDTNGTNPDMIRKLIDRKLIDYIAMDIKGPLNKYKEITRSNINPELIKKTLKIIKNSKIPHEFRSTILPDLHSHEDIKEMSEMSESSDYYLQNFKKIKNKLLDPAFIEKRSFNEEELELLKQISHKDTKVRN